MVEDDSIPVNWKILNFEDFATLQRGKDLTKEQFKQGSIPVASSNGIIGFHNIANVYSPGVTVGRSGSVGKVTYYEDDFWAHNTCLYVKDFHGNHPLFTAYYLQFLNLARFKTGASVPTLDRNSFRKLPICIPNQEEQRKIAIALSLVQDAIAQQEQLITLTTEMKTSLMHKLFTEGTHGEPQKMTEIGLIPESWDVVPLDDLLTLTQYGLSVKGKDFGNYPILRMTNQLEGKIVRKNLQYVEIKQEELEKFKIKYGDILFNRTNSFELVGRTAIFDIDGDFVFASYLIRLRVNAEKLNPFFLNHYFSWDKTQIRLKGIATRAVSQSNISASRLKRFIIPLPKKLAVQDEIVKSLDYCDSRIAVHRQKSDILNHLFHTLLHQLMTAQIRVDDLNLSTLNLGTKGGNE
jgi:type I restriction enzyme S subunit